MYIKTIILKSTQSQDILLCSLQQAYNNNIEVKIKCVPSIFFNYSNLFLCVITNGSKYCYLLEKQSNHLYCSIKANINLSNNNLYITIGTYDNDKCSFLASSNNNEQNLLQKDYQIIQNIKNLFDNTKSREIVPEKECELTKANDEDAIIDHIITDTSLSFYEQIKPNLDALFVNNIIDETLQNLVPNSKFAKITQNCAQSFHSVGIIYNAENEPEYICYALPCKMGDNPPPNMEKYAQLLPVNHTEAYYLMYQNAQTGENIIINQ